MTVVQTDPLKDTMQLQLDQSFGEFNKIALKLFAIRDMLNAKDSLHSRRWLRECMQTVCDGKDLSGSQCEEFEKQIEQLKLYLASLKSATTTEDEIKVSQGGAEFVHACLCAKIAIQRWTNVTPGADASFVGLRMKGLHIAISKSKEFGTPEGLAKGVDASIKLLTISEDEASVALPADRLHEIADSQWKQCQTELAKWLADQDPVCLITILYLSCSVWFCELHTN